MTSTVAKVQPKQVVRLRSSQNVTIYCFCVLYKPLQFFFLRLRANLVGPVHALFMHEHMPCSCVAHPHVLRVPRPLGAANAQSSTSSRHEHVL